MKIIRTHLPWAACLLFFATAAVTPAGAAAPAASPKEESLLRMTNSVRVEQGLAPLQWDDALAQAARAHAALLAQNAQLSHQFPEEPDLAVRAAQAGAHFQSVAENIAEGFGIESIQKGWMKSAPHRANILDPSLNAVGFAVVERGGSLYAVADFATAVPSLSVDQVEATVAKMLLARGVEASGPRLDARQTCEMSQGSAGGSDPRFVMRWQSSDLTGLPQSLEDELGTKGYRKATVGACASAKAESGFTAYRVAVLLYR